MLFVDNPVQGLVHGRIKQDLHSVYSVASSQYSTLIASFSKVPGI